MSLRAEKAKERERHCNKQRKAINEAHDNAVAIEVDGARNREAMVVQNLLGNTTIVSRTEPFALSPTPSAGPPHRPS